MENIPNNTEHPIFTETLPHAIVIQFNNPSFEARNAKGDLISGIYEIKILNPLNRKKERIYLNDRHDEFPPVASGDEILELYFGSGHILTPSNSLFVIQGLRKY